MKLSKHYTFDVREAFNPPYVTIYGSDDVGIWKGDEETEFRVEMNFKQGKEVAHALLRLIAARREKDNPQVCGHYDKDGYFVEDIDEDNQQA